MTTEAQHFEIARRVMSDEQPILVTITIKEAWLLVSGLQLATRHPGLSSQMRQLLTEIAMQFQQPIVERHPEAEAPLDLGWDPKHDK